MGEVVPRNEAATQDPYIDDYMHEKSLLRMPTRSRLLTNESIKKGRPSIVGKLRRETLGQYLQGDRKVLRFYCMWDDSSRLYGEKRRFIMHYFLSDDTIEVRNVEGKNSGRDPFPMLLKRARLPRDWKQKTDDSQYGRNEEKYYVCENLTLGSVIDVYGRHLVLLSCDDFTRDFYKRDLNITQTDVHYLAPRPKKIERIIAPYNGFGSEEDSLANVLHLVPKKPLADLHSFLKNQGKVLRFRARMVTESPDDIDRRFVISYFMENDTLAIYEPPMRNTGIVGGRFLERRRYKLPLKLKEVKAVPTNCLKMQEELQVKVQRKMGGGPSQLLDAFKVFGGIGGGNDISVKEFQYGMLMIGMDVTMDEARELYDVYDEDKSGSLDFDEFIRGVMQDTVGEFGSAASKWTSRWVRPADLVKGATVSFLTPETGAKSPSFVVQEPDGFTKAMMRDFPELFPSSNVQVVAANLAQALVKWDIKPSVVFRELDPHRTGSISTDQFKDVIVKWATDFDLVDEDLTDVEVATLISHYDEDNSGCIDYQEFADALIAAPLYAHRGGKVKKKGIHNAELTLLKKIGADDPLNVKKLFQSMDPDKDGHLPMEDFMRLMKFKEVSFTEDELALFVEKYDADGDGVIDYERMFKNAFVTDTGAQRDGFVEAEVVKEDEYVFPCVVCACGIALRITAFHIMQCICHYGLPAPPSNLQSIRCIPLIALHWRSLYISPMHPKLTRTRLSFLLLSRSCPTPCYSPWSPSYERIARALKEKGSERAGRLQHIKTFNSQYVAATLPWPHTLHSLRSLTVSGVVLTKCHCNTHSPNMISSLRLRTRALTA